METAQAALSRRECEVAALVAEGLSNREIAEKLFISERTAEGHVEQIRNKLGFKSRAQVAAWVASNPTQLVPKASPLPTPAPVLSRGVSRLRARWFWRIGIAMTVVAAGTFAIAVVGPTLGPALVGGPPISTFAGTGHIGVSQDGLSAAATDLIGPHGLAVSPNGDVYLADGARIRMVHGGIVTSVAGTGVPGFSGNGGLALQTQLALGGGLVGMALDRAGNLFVSDPNNSRVLKITPDGKISVVLSAFEPRGIAIDEQGDIFVAETFANQVVKLDPSGAQSLVAGTGRAGFSGDNGPALSAELSAPEGLAVDHSGALYIADAGNDVVRKVSPDGRISTFAGDGKTGSGGDGGPATKAEFFLPTAVAVDAGGNLYIADSANNQIRKVDLAGDISTVAGTEQAGFSGDGKAATAARLNEPVAVAVDSAGNLYIADQGNNRVRLVQLGKG